jgi:hypothetical protein
MKPGLLFAVGAFALLAVHQKTVIHRLPWTILIP